MRINFYLVILILFGLDSFSQEISTYRIINVTLDVSAPTDLILNQGRLVWKDRDPGLQTYGLSYYSGAEIFRLDSNLTGLTHAIDGDYIGWNTSEEVIKVFNVRDWSIRTVGPSYNPDSKQPFAIAGGNIAYARKEGSGSEIVVRDLVSGNESIFNEGIWNLQPSLHHGQLAWVQKFLADTSISNIYFFDGQSTRLLTYSASSQNLHPVLKDGNVAWIQSEGNFRRVKLFNGDSILTLAEAGSGYIISGYDLSDGNAIASITNLQTNSTTIRVYSSETGIFSEIVDTANISGLHIDNGLICWSWGTGAIKNLKIFHLETGELEEWGAARYPVVDDGMVAWTLGDAVDMLIPVTYRQLSSGDANGWPQSRFKDHDGTNVIWGNLDNSTKARLFYSNGNSTIQLTDSIVYKDFITLNDGYSIWRHDFTSLYLFDGTNPPELIVDSLQCENMYLADGAIGFHGFRTDAGNNINQAWLYHIGSKELKQLSFDDSSNVTNTFTLVDNNYACWHRDSANNSMLMLYDGAGTDRLTDSSVYNEFGFRDGKIIWSERNHGFYQVMLYDVSTKEKKQITGGINDKYKPITDGSAVVWFEDDAAGPVMWYYDIAGDSYSKIAHFSPPVARWLWLSNGKISWADKGEVCVFDGNIICRLTSSAPYNPNSDPFLDGDVLVWNKNNPDPNIQHYGQVFMGKLRAHVSFDASNITGEQPLSVDFQNQSFQGGSSYLWEFGDGETSTEKNPVHTYQYPGTYSVTLHVEDLTGTSSEKKANLVRVSQLTSTSEFTSHPASFRLYQNYPNPFSQSTTIPFRLPASCQVTVMVYDMQGNQMEKLVKGIFPQGFHEIPFTGSSLPGGSYIIQLIAGSKTESIVVNLIK